MVWFLGANLVFGLGAIFSVSLSHQLLPSLAKHKLKKYNILKMIQYKKKNLVSLIIFTSLMVGVFFLAWPSSPAVISQNPRHPAPASTNSNFNKQRYSINSASSLWVVVNKGRALAAGYVPSDLIVPNVSLRLSASSSEMLVRPDSGAALEAMFKQASDSGVYLRLASGYRSYSTQLAVHQNYANTQGAVNADTFSARAGHSEHQTGLAADIEPLSRTCELDQCFENTPEGQWLATNAYKFGFIIRYQKNTQKITGYQYEPWHIRYVGTDLAAQLNASGQTMEEFFNLATFDEYPATNFELSQN